MKKIALILTVMLLASCAGMGTRDDGGASGSATGGTSGMSGSGSTNQMDINRHDDPSDIYFGG